MMMEAEKFRRAVRKLEDQESCSSSESKEACQWLNWRCEFKSQAGSFETQRGVDVSAQVQRPEKSSVWLSPSGRKSLSQPFLPVFTPAGADNLLYSAC